MSVTWSAPGAWVAGGKGVRHRADTRRWVPLVIAEQAVLEFLHACVDVVADQLHAFAALDAAGAGLVRLPDFHPHAVDIRDLYDSRLVIEKR